MFSLNGNHFLVAVDAFSKWVECFIMSTTDSEAVVLKLCEMFSRFGLVKVIVTDNGTNFCSAYFNNFCLSNGVKHVTIAPYHPASNGQAENTVKTFKRGIQLFLSEKEGSKTLVAKLYEYLFNYRNSVHCTTGVSPAELMFGRKLRCRLDLICDRTSSCEASPSAESLVVSVKDNVCAKQISQSNTYGGHRKVDFKKGDKVLFKFYFKNGTKHTWKFGIINKIIGSRMYRVFVPEQNVYVRKHLDQIVLYKGFKNSMMCDSDDVSCFGDYGTNEHIKSTMSDESAVSKVSSNVSPSINVLLEDNTSSAFQQDRVEKERSESVAQSSNVEQSSVGAADVKSPGAPSVANSDCDEQLTPSRRYPLRIRNKRKL